MKVKDLERTANIAWSPAPVSPIYLAAGTAGQQLDATFDTRAALEIFALALHEPGAELEARAAVASEHRFHALAWSTEGAGDAGTLVGGCDRGVLQIYDATRLLHDGCGNSAAAPIGKQEKHTGAVHALDFNPFQSYLLATGAAASEIFIWDLNNLGAPMTPGTKSQPYEDVLGVQWNRQVQHILASTFATKCVVWDLRKNETIIKLTDSVSRIRWKTVAWHPEVATQLCLASEEDQVPVVQLWDLRFATSPLKTLEGHQRGVLSMAWCAADADLLVTGGKDNRIVCWNPNSNTPGGEVLAEVARTNQWSFDLAWCPKNPALIASPSFDGHVSVYSLHGGKAQQIQTTNKIADSFPGMDAGDYVQAPVQQPSAAIANDLSKAPKWLRKPVGGKFGFGGKLITFDHDKSTLALQVQQQQQQQPTANGQAPHVPRIVYISQVVTEVELVQKSTELEEALEYGNFTEYCRNKADASGDQHTRYVWHFLKANFEASPRTEFLNLLGYKIEDVNAKLAQHVPADEKAAHSVDSSIYDINQQFAANRIDSGDAFNQISIQQQQQQQQQMVVEPYEIKTGDDADGLIAQALLLNNVEAAAALCVQAKRYADAIIIAMTGGPELLARIQTKYLAQCDGYVSSLIAALVTENWAAVIRDCQLDSWREALAAALTHAADEDLPALCELMGARLERAQRLQDAQLCYICAGSFEKLVESWSSAHGAAAKTTASLQELVELVTFLQRAVERQGKQVQVQGRLAELLASYAMLLAAQGSLGTALAYLSSGVSTDPTVTLLRERLYVALGHKPGYGQVQNRSRHNTNRSSISSSVPASAAPGFNTAQPWAQPAPPVVTQPPPAAAMWQAQPQQPPQPQQAWQPAMFTPAPPVNSNVQAIPPPRPGSVGPGGLPKSKYVLDPSVQSGVGSYGNHHPQQQMRAAANNNFGATPFAPAPANLFTPMMQPEVADIAPPPLAMGNSAMNALPAHAAPGWNDPPVSHKPVKLPVPKGDVPAMSPITHPIFGTAPTPANGCMDGQPPPPQQQPFNPYGNPPNNVSMPPLPSPHHHQQQPVDAMPGPMMFTPQPQQQQQQQQMPLSQFGQFNTQPILQQSAHNFDQQQQQATPTAAAVPEAVAKLPIPEEHIHMQTVFDELRVQCGRAANNPQTKRKIEDVAKKLETLYDLLREHKLSPNALAGLHQMVQQVQHGDYTGGLQMHTQLVSGPDFAQIAGFMPGLKVLLQCALQLQVYLR